MTQKQLAAEISFDFGLQATQGNNEEFIMTDNL